MTSRLALPALALALALTGCDATGDTSTPATSSDVSDAAATIASAVALDGGGALDDAASVAALTTASADKAARLDDRPGCTGERVFDEGTSTWLSTLSCERGNPEGLFYHAFSRSTTHRFLDEAGEPLPGPEGAAAVEFSIVDGEGEHLTPRASYELDDLGANLDVVRLGDGNVSVDGIYEREGVRTFFGRGEAEREVDYALSLDLDEVTGPAGRRDRWAGAVSGSVSGVYTATVTATGPGGETNVREVERTFTVTFPVEGRARIAIGGRTFDVNTSTGEVL